MFAEDVKTTMRKFTTKELAQYTGKNGTPAYIAFKGKVYDVSRSFLWRDGKHQVVHNAGKDLTEGLDEAPHGADLLERFPLVGTLQDD
jgi:predicted heme/steroid binding protein